MAKDCKVPVKCSECGSEKHLAALHVDRKEKPKEPDQVHGRKQKNESQQTREGKVSQQQKEQSPSITTTCTEICGDKPGGRSCSKICIANIYVKGHPDKKVKAYILTMTKVIARWLGRSSLTCSILMVRGSLILCEHVRELCKQKEDIQVDS